MALERGMLQPEACPGVTAEQGVEQTEAARGVALDRGTDPAERGAELGASAGDTLLEQALPGVRARGLRPTMLLLRPDLTEDCALSSLPAQLWANGDISAGTL